MKRFTDTEKWKDPWFRGLKGAHKLVFLYVVDNCNNAGFYEVDEGMMAFQTGLEDTHIKGAWKGLERGLKGAEGWVWVRRFLRHQKNEPLNAVNPAHKQIIALVGDQLGRFSGIPEFDEFIAPLKGLLSPIGKGIGKGEQRKEGVQGKPNSKTFAPTSEIELRVAKLFNRRPSTTWSDDEAKAFRKIGEIDPEELSVIEAYYARERAKGDDGIHRRDLSTFLNNWNGELDRARASSSKSNGAGTPNLFTR